MASFLDPEVPQAPRYALDIRRSFAEGFGARVSLQEQPGIVCSPAALAPRIVRSAAFVAYNATPIIVVFTPLRV
jgi:hypothetical protein